MNFNIIKWLKDLVVGFFIGLANIIPGVSGGTFLLIFGIYERVINVVNGLNSKTVIEIFTSTFSILKSSDKNSELQKLFKLLNKLDLFFFSRLILGALFAIVVLSALMKYLLENQFSVTYALFFGLILTSTIIPFKLIKKRAAILILPFIAGTALTLFVATSVNPAEKAVKKSDRYKKRFEIALGEKNLLKEDTAKTTDASETAFSYTGKYSAGEYLYAAFTGSVAISAMVLPGISGSLVMILMGEYFEVINAISGLKTVELDYIFFLTSFSLGMLFGLLLFAKLIKIIFDKFYDTTMAFLLGLMAGSLYTLWPFKSFITIKEQFIKSDGVVIVKENVDIFTNHNILWKSSEELIPAVIAFGIGAVIMFLFSKREISDS